MVIPVDAKEAFCFQVVCPNQTLVNGVVVATGQLIRFCRSSIQGQGHYEVICEELLEPISPEYCVPQLDELFTFWGSCGQGQGTYKVKYLGVQKWRFSFRLGLCQDESFFELNTDLIVQL